MHTGFLAHSTFDLPELLSAVLRSCMPGRAVFLGDTSTVVACYFYQHISGLFSHERPEVSWHPKPAT